MVTWVRAMEWATEVADASGWLDDETEKQGIDATDYFNPPMAAVISWMHCRLCGRHFRTDGDQVLNVADFLTLGNGGFSLRHWHCEEEA